MTRMDSLMEIRHSNLSRHAVEFSNEEQKHRVETQFDHSESWQGRLYDDSSDPFNRAMVRRKQYSMEMLKQNIKPLSGRALDVGCGCGEYIADLSALGFESYGVDLSREMLRVCQKRCQLDDRTFHERFRQGDIEQIPFDQGEFDLVVCVGVLGYLLEDTKALREVHRVLKIGGYFLVSVQNMMSLANIDYVARRRLTGIFGLGDARERRDEGRHVTMACPWIFQNARVPHYYKLYNLWKFEQMVQAFGFEKVDSRTTGYEFRIIRRWKLLPERIVTKMELKLESLVRSVRMPYLPYSGDTYIGLFQKRWEAIEEKHDIGE